MARTGWPATASALRCRKSASAFSRISARPGSCRACRARPAPGARSPASGIEAADATALGLATHRVPSARLPDLLDGLCGAVPVDALLAAFAEPAVAALQRTPPCHRPAVRAPTGSRTSCRRSIPPVRRPARMPRLRAARRPRSAQNRPPVSRSLWRRLRRGKSLDFEACLRTEFRIVSRVVTGHDFYEGIRAVIVDKDQSPALAAADARRRQRRRRGAAILRRSPPNSICHDRSDHHRSTARRSIRFRPARRRGAPTAGRRGSFCSCA